MTFLLESPGPSGSNLHVYRILRSRERVWLAQFMCLSLNALSQAAGQPRNGCPSGQIQPGPASSGDGVPAKGFVGVGVSR